jgi:hypothetical protein
MSRYATVVPGVVGCGTYALLTLIDDAALTVAHPLTPSAASSTTPAIPRVDVSLRMAPTLPCHHGGRPLVPPQNVLAPLVAAENAAAAWAGLDISRKRAVVKTLMSVTLYSPGRGAPRAFDPATVQVTWNQPDTA